MASMRKVNERAASAAEDYRHAAAVVVIAALEARVRGIEPFESETYMRMKRRAGAYHARWMAAERLAEEMAAMR
jgi:hypothetical protein